MATKAKHGYGSLEKVDQSIQSGVLDAFDVLFVTDSEGKPYVGWVSKDGKKQIVDPYSGVSELESAVDTKLASKADSAEVEAQLATKVDSTEVDEKLATKADASAVEVIETQLAEKVDAATVQAMIEEHSESAIEVVEF